MPSEPNSRGPAGPEAAGAEPLFDEAQKLNPFVGLRPFESTEALLFFGRDEQTTELMQQLHGTRFVAVSGSSGCGKSSLVRAGLIPKLKAGFLLNDRGRWHFATMKPGKSPLQNLAAALLAAFNEEPTGERLRRLVEEIEMKGAAAVTEYLAPRLGGGETNVLLLVDQFEEIFRFGSFTEDDDPTEDPDEREQRRAEAADFVSIMLELTRGTTVPVYVVMTMRSDFLGDCDAFHGLPEAMNRSSYLVPRLTRQQRLEAVQCPVRLCGKGISPELAVCVLEDMGEDPDQLPVMQHAMMRTWEKFTESGGQEVAVEHYEAIGTIKHALSLDADAALERASERELKIAERLFQALVEVDVKGRRLRRPVNLSDIVKITGAGRDEVLKVVERFSSHNRSFLVLSEDHLRGDWLIDISHESLIRQWETLSRWVNAEVESRELYLRLAGDAVRYFATPRTATLWREQALQQALDWWGERRPNAAWASRYHMEFALAEEFLKQSEQRRAEEEAAAEAARVERERAEREELERAQRDADEKREQAEALAAARAAELRVAQHAAEQQAAAVRRQRRYLVALAIISAFMLLSTVFSVYAMSKANEETQRANAQTRRAESLAVLLDKELKSETAEKEEAKQQKAEAEKQKGIAEQKAGEAVAARQQAVAAAAEAKKQEALAKGERARAVAALDWATHTAEADSLHRQANKEQEATEKEQAEVTYLQAVKKYNSLLDYDGVAHTYTELGKLSLDNQDEDEDEDTPERKRGERPAAAQRQGERRNWVESVLLADATGEEPLYNIGLTDAQAKGVRYYAAAIKTYRAHGDPQHTDFFNGSAAALDKVGDFLSSIDDKKPTDDEDEQRAAKARARAERDSFCAALSDYQQANNLKGQATLLTKIGDRVDSASGDEEGAAQDETDSATARAHAEPAGCPDIGGDAAAYYEKAIPLYNKLIVQPGILPEQLRARRKEFADMLIKLGLVYLNRHRDDLAKQRFDAAAGVYRNANDLENTVTTLMAIGLKLDEPLMSEYYADAAKEYHAAGKFEEEANQLTLIGRRYRTEALSLSRVADAALSDASRRKKALTYDKAIEFFQTALAAYERVEGLATQDDKRKAIKSRRALVALLLGDCYLYSDKPESALESYKLAQQLSEDIGDKKSQERAFYFIGNAQKKLGQKPDAIKSYENAIRLAEDAGEGGFKGLATDALDSLRTTPTPTPSPAPSPTRAEQASPAGPFDVEVELMGAPAGAVAPAGKAEYQVHSHGNHEFKVRVKNVNLPAGATLEVFLDGHRVGTITLDDDRGGKLKLETDDGQTVPQIGAQALVEVKDQNGNTVLAGTLSNAQRAATGKGSRE